jgi:rhodanese-related sulfurtransferase
VVAVLDTHRHVDHESARSLLCEVLGDRMQTTGPSSDRLGWPDTANATISLGDGTRAPVLAMADDLVVAKTPLPGHTEDGQLYLVGTPDADGGLPPARVRFAFPGDTLQIGGIGRTDFPVSAPIKLLRSLRRLPQLISDHTIICPTHDYPTGFVTTLEAECRNNPFLARILDPTDPLTDQQFLTEKKRIDAQIDDAADDELVCGRIQYHSDVSRTSVDLAAEDLPDFFREHARSRIVDVREPQEFQFAQNWESLGLSAPPENIPLTRLANFLAQSMESPITRQQPIIFLCRSGNRSGKAAEVARRLGIPNAWNVAGGIALGVPPGRVEQDEMEYII